MKATPSRAVRALAAPPAPAAKTLRPAAVLAAIPILAAALLAIPASAAAAAVAGASAAPADFSGRWMFSPAKSANIGMMAGLEIHAAVEQSPAALTVHEDSTFQGQKSARDLRYDLGGKPVPNRSPMGDPSETVSRWEGSRLVTTWTSQGAVAGTKVVRTETRSLSADGRTMTLESVRGSAGPVVMIFERE
jgi:hypothetical protein